MTGAFKLWTYLRSEHLLFPLQVGLALTSSSSFVYQVMMNFVCSFVDFFSLCLTTILRIIGEGKVLNWLPTYNYYYISPCVHKPIQLSFTIYNLLRNPTNVTWYLVKYNPNLLRTLHKYFVLKNLYKMYDYHFRCFHTNCLL